MITLNMISSSQSRNFFTLILLHTRSVKEQLIEIPKKQYFKIRYTSTLLQSLFQNLKSQFNKKTLIICKVLKSIKTAKPSHVVFGRIARKVTVCLSAKFPHQEIRRKYGILRTVSLSSSDVLGKNSLRSDNFLKFPQFCLVSLVLFRIMILTRLSVFVSSVFSYL